MSYHGRFEWTGGHGAHERAVRGSGEACGARRKRRAVNAARACPTVHPVPPPPPNLAARASEPAHTPTLNYHPPNSNESTHHALEGVGLARAKRSAGRHWCRMTRSGLAWVRSVGGGECWSQGGVG